LPESPKSRWRCDYVSIGTPNPAIDAKRANVRPPSKGQDGPWSNTSTAFQLAIRHWFRGEETRDESQICGAPLTGFLSIDRPR
jgi:hypothetical protein